MTKVTIQPEVKAILERSTFGTDRITLPPEQLSRPQYIAVMKVLDAQGGRWSKKEKCHLFPVNPQSIFSEALQNGHVVHAKKTRQAFYTPPDVVSTVLAYANPENGVTVLEPSAGDGAFADAIRERGARVTCVESDESAVRVLMSKGHEVLGVDFLALGNEGFEFDMVVMNPPFTKGQDVKHVTHAFKFLRPGGSLFAIMPSGFEHNDTNPYRHFRDLLASNGHILERFDNHEFRESGTDISTRLVKLTR
jgi:predicted RNA methylase